MSESYKDENLIEKIIDWGIETLFKGVNMVENLIGRLFATMVAIFILMTILKNWRFLIP